MAFRTCDDKEEDPVTDDSASDLKDMMDSDDGRRGGYVAVEAEVVVDERVLLLALLTLDRELANSESFDLGLPEAGV